MRAPGRTGGKFPALDDFRLVAAVLVVANHTRSAQGELLWLLTVLRRTAVPYFLMTSGYFLARDGWRSAGRLWRRTALLYGIGVLLYLPLNRYAGQLSPDFLRRVLLDGSFYHLWYFPALLLGLPAARLLRRLGQRRALLIAGGLYLIGLGGDSWYGLLPEGLARLYGGVFRVFTYTRNGLFYVPLFLLLGAAGITLGRRASLAGLLASLSMLASEALFLHRAGVQRSDSMYLCLPPAAVFLFSLPLACNQGERRALRRLAAPVYLLHPWCIVLVRRSAEAAGLTALLVENTLIHFLAVLALTLLLSRLLLAAAPPRPYPKGRAWVELDLAALRHNAERLRSLLPEGCGLMPAVKAGAYGHGAAMVARELNRLGVRAFCTATAEEGAALRRRGVRGEILVLGYTHPRDLPLLRRWRLTQTVLDGDYARQLEAFGRPLRVQLKLDTGMHRLGLPAEDGEALARVFACRRLRVTGVFTHLCAAELETEEAARFTLAQGEAFFRAVEDLRRRGLDCGRVHLLASGGLLRYPSLGGSRARVGIALYGALGREAGLRPVLAVKARVALVRPLRAGESAGYDFGYTAPGERRIAVLSIGYADGLPRGMSQGRGRVLIRGMEAEIAGFVCMDQTLADVTGIPGVERGDTAVIIGCSGGREITAREAAEACGTIPNELLSRLGGRLGRVTVDSPPPEGATRP